MSRQLERVDAFNLNPLRYGDDDLASFFSRVSRRTSRRSEHDVGVLLDRAVSKGQSEHGR